MANNRLWLLHRPSGERIFLGKRMALGWYGAPDDLGAQITELYEKIEREYGVEEQDDFVLAMEDVTGAPHAIALGEPPQEKPQP